MEQMEGRRRREFAFLSEIPELFDLRFEGGSTVDGRSVWVVSGQPRPGAKAKSGDAKMLLKLRGRMWIDKATYQWARVEAETTDTISWGLFLARLNSGAKMIFEQTEVNTEADRLLHTYECFTMNWWMRSNPRSSSCIDVA